MLICRICGSDEIGCFDDDAITLAIVEPDTPLLLSDDQDDSHGVVIMPMRA